MDDIGGDTTRIGLMYELLSARDGESLEEAAARVVRELDDARDTIVDQLVNLADLRAKVERLTRELDEASRGWPEALASTCHDLRAEADDLRAQVERLTRERDYWRQQMELAGPELDRLRRNCPACGRSVDVSGLCWPECHSAEADELRELAWRWCIEARAQLRRREAER